MRGPPLSLKARALQWLAQREHSRIELRRKLLRLARQRAVAAQDDGRGIEAASAAPDPAPEVDTLLDWLVAQRVLSDTRFVESRVNARAARYGNLRIRRIDRRDSARAAAPRAPRSGRTAKRRCAPPTGRPAAWQ